MVGQAGVALFTQATQCPPIQGIGGVLPTGPGPCWTTRWGSCGARPAPPLTELGGSQVRAAPGSRGCSFPFRSQAQGGEAPRRRQAGTLLRAGRRSAHQGLPWGWGPPVSFTRACRAHLGTAPGEPGARDTRSPAPLDRVLCLPSRGGECLQGHPSPRRSERLPRGQA